MRAYVLALVLALHAACLAQEPGEKLCGDCHSTGKIPHPQKPLMLEQERDVEFCSFWMDSDPEALALDWIVCPNCQTPSAQQRARQEFDAEFARRKAWLEERREKVDKVTRTECVHVQTKHFLIAWDIPEIKVGRKVYKAHEAAHLYVQRAEELYAYILDLHGISEAQTLGTRFELYMFESERAARTIAPLMTNLPLQKDPKVQLIGPKTSRMVWWDDPSKVIDDKYRHQMYVHCLSHHIHHDICLGPYKFWLFKSYGWMFEGLAFYMEHRLFGPPKVTCSQEAGGFGNYRDKSWEALVKKDVIDGTYPNFQDVISKAADALTDQDRHFAWSYVDYLMWIDPHKMPALITAMTGEQLPTRDALRQAYDMSVGEFVDGWLEFVNTEYSTRPAKGPIVRQPRGTKKEE